jgi:serine phosphatase RsbU (regulator of sigma subunit)
MYGILHIENTEHMKLDESDRFMLEAIAEFLGISTERIRLLNKITHQNHLLEEQAKDLRTALRKVESQKEIIEKQNTRLIQDLRKAGDFQKSLLPDSLPQFENIHFATSYIPSSQLGGDLYDIFNIDDDLVGIILADASGHGVAAAMLSAMFKMTLQKYAAEIVDPSQVMTRLNSDFCQVLQMGEFFTAFYAILNRRTGRFIYSNAAHPRPLLFNYKDGSMLELDTEGFLLGVMEEGIGYEQKELQLDGKIRLMIYTDGVNEATNAEEKQYGDDRVRMRLMEHAGDNPEDFLESIRKDLIKYTGSDTFEDDVSILVMDFEKQ